MKMEVLSVQNHHIQKQFGVIGSTKVKKDWTSSLTPPSSRTTTPPTNLTAASTTPSSTNTTTTATTFYNSLHSPIEHFDVVDGLKPQHNTAYFTHTNNSSHHQYQQQHSQHTFDMETATAASASPKGVVGIESTGSAHYAYNNNLLYCAPNTTTVATNTTAVAAAVSNQMSSYHHHHSPLTGIPIAALTPSPVSSTLSTPTEATEHFGIAHDDDVDAAAVNELSQRLQAELRAAKSRHLSCTEVSLPWDLTPRIAADMIKTSEREPCGVRGCAIFIDFEDETGSARRIASFKVDPNTVSTFELFLTLKQDKGGWTSLLPQFLKNLTRSSTILISPHFSLNKHKLYACE
ncbi:protein charybde-like [Lucilia cuprina]|uniref:protein charybde-like n=1 Tax=Lucilia cuprina TaxID=7375 RepID=UPI001F06E684|nr:protein charybde-like [Lucilia cuprina]